MLERITEGDTITYRPCFGMHAPKQAQVEAMELTARPRQKYGEPRTWVPLQAVKENRVVFNLDDGHWCYSDQLVLE